MKLTAEQKKQRKEAAKIKKRLEQLRKILKSESISYDELHELQSLARHIPAGDMELLEAAGVPESEAHKEGPDRILDDPLNPEE